MILLFELLSFGDEKEKKVRPKMHSCTEIPGKQWFLWDIPGVAGIVHSW